MKHTTIFFFLTIISLTALHANPNLNGAWTATIEQNRSLDTFKINLSDNGRCNVKVSNDNASQETSGTWSFDGTMFRLNVTFRNAKISYIPNIQWTSLINFASDNNSFNILGRTAAGGSQSRITFYKDDGFDEEFNENVIPQIFITLRQNIPMRSRLAIVGITSPNLNEAAFYLNELTIQFINSKQYTVVDRNNIDTVLAEQKFQLSGFVEDSAIVSIGKFFEANVVITGNISGTGSQKRLVVKAIDVTTSEILSMASMGL